MSISIIYSMFAMFVYLFSTLYSTCTTNVCYICAVHSKHYFCPLAVQSQVHHQYPGPIQQTYGTDYSRAGQMHRPRHQGSMLNRVQESLTCTLMEPGAVQGEEDYDYKPVSELTTMFKPSRQKPTYRKCDWLYHHIPE